MIKLSDQLHKCGYQGRIRSFERDAGSIAHDLLANAIALSAIWPYFPTPHRKIIHPASPFRSQATANLMREVGQLQRSVMETRRSVMVRPCLSMSPLAGQGRRLFNRRNGSKDRHRLSD